MSLFQCAYSNRPVTELVRGLRVLHSSCSNHREEFCETKHRRAISIACFLHSVWPLDWLWNPRKDCLAPSWLQKYIHTNATEAEDTIQDQLSYFRGRRERGQLHKMCHLAKPIYDRWHGHVVTRAMRYRKGLKETSRVWWEPFVESKQNRHWQNHRCPHPGWPTRNVGECSLFFGMPGNSWATGPLQNWGS